MPLQVEGDAHVGGRGGENYRSFIIADTNSSMEAFGLAGSAARAIQAPSASGIDRTRAMRFISPSS